MKVQATIEFSLHPVSTQGVSPTYIGTSRFSAAYLHEVLHKPVVEVLATQMGVAGGGLHLEDALQDDDVRQLRSHGRTPKQEFD